LCHHVDDAKHVPARQGVVDRERARVRIAPADHLGQVDALFRLAGSDDRAAQQRMRLHGRVDGAGQGLWGGDVESGMTVVEGGRDG
jgi:hypothetical protein